MEKLLFIDACMRDDSRTKKIANFVLEKLSKNYTIQNINLSDGDVVPLNKLSLEQRFDNDIDPKYVTYAKMFAHADRIVIAAPFWDMSFPAVLKAFFEQISLLNITFKDGDNKCVGLCKAKKILYITTRGMNIRTGSKLEQASPYIKAFAWLCGIKKVITISANNLDYLSPSDVTQRLKNTMRKSLKLIKNF